MLDETLLADVDVTLAWAAFRVWKAGDRLLEWTGSDRALGIYFVEQGVLDVTLGGNCWHLGPGQFFLLPPLIQRDRLATVRGATWISVGIVPMLHGRLPLAGLIPAPNLWTLAEPQRQTLISWLHYLVDAWEEGPAGSLPVLANPGRPRGQTQRLIAEGMAKAIFALCWQELRPESVQNAASLQAPDWLLDTLYQIRKTPAITLTEICNRTGISAAHLRRMFHRYIGQSPHAYLSQCRLERARTLLETTSLTIATVAIEVGFDSLSHFTKLFTQHYRVSPARYRQNHKKGLT
jgi:AraC-like DNA-binding protein